MLRIGLLTDYHYAVDDGDLGRHRADGARRLSHALPQIQQGALEYIVTLGDMSDHAGTTADQRIHQGQIAGILRSSGVEVRPVLGNHDVACFEKAECLAAYGLRRKRAYYAWDHAPWRLIVLDTNVHEDGRDITPLDQPSHWRENWLGQAQLEWLRRQLRGSGDRPVAIFSHANLNPRPGEVDGLDDHNVRDCHEALDIILHEGDVRVVFQGHCHAGHFEQVECTRFITLRGACEGDDPVSAGIAYCAEDGTCHFAGFGAQPEWL
jgi:hypothetical protein